jgi:hypothetical protein
MNSDLQLLLTDIVRDHAKGYDLIVRIEANRATLEEIGLMFQANANPDPEYVQSWPGILTMVMGIPMVVKDDLPNGEWKVVRRIGGTPLPDMTRANAPEPSVPRDQDLCPQCGNAWVGDQTPCSPIHAAVRREFHSREGS